MSEKTKIRRASPRGGHDPDRSEGTQYAELYMSTPEPRGMLRKKSEETTKSDTRGGGGEKKREYFKEEASHLSARSTWRSYRLADQEVVSTYHIRSEKLRIRKTTTNKNHQTEHSELTWRGREKNSTWSRKKTKTTKRKTLRRPGPSAVKKEKPHLFNRKRQTPQMLKGDDIRFKKEGELLDKTKIELQTKALEKMLKNW